MSEVLTSNQLEALFYEIEERFSAANQSGKIRDILEHLGWSDILNGILPADNNFHSYPTGKVVVLGGSEVKENKLWGVCKELGFTDKDRFEFNLDFGELIRYPYRKLQYQPQYRLVLVGPISHKTQGTGDYSSMIGAMENEQGYPRVVRLTANEAMKITKSNFKMALRELIAAGFLSP